MKRYFAILSALMLFVLFNTSCTEKESEKSVVGKIYTYSGEAFSELESDYAFTITINDDGTYSYYESLFSSYIGTGEWSVTDDVLTLSDDTGIEIINYFLIDGDDLVFIEENSTNFIYVKVKDGERFHGTAVSDDK